ncbi:VOC family protein [Sulfuriflexus mobilis]|uniref:VOC family protein n=1 Tax=Sulfuriflexus mobilis TaxID=1811807 RepID=UPI000F84CF96|nr:VOC family protein [Sulfuriflexus mobilis]
MTYNIKIQHVSFIVADTGQSLRFYCDVLGLEVCPHRPELGYPGAWLQLDEGQQIHLLELANPDPVTGRPQHGGRDRHIAFNISDLSSIRNALTEAGLVFTLSRSGRKALFCRDPDGNTLEFIQI